jgi:hypothetical protein
LNQPLDQSELAKVVGRDIELHLERGWTVSAVDLFGGVPWAFLFLSVEPRWEKLVAERAPCRSFLRLDKALLLEGIAWLGNAAAAVARVLGVVLALLGSFVLGEGVPHASLVALVVAVAVVVVALAVALVLAFGSGVP